MIMALQTSPPPTTISHPSPSVRHWFKFFQCKMGLGTFGWVGCRAITPNHTNHRESPIHLTPAIQHRYGSPNSTETSILLFLPIGTPFLRPPRMLESATTTSSGSVRWQSLMYVRIYISLSLSLYNMYIYIILYIYIYVEINGYPSVHYVLTLPVSNQYRINSSITWYQNHQKHLYNLNCNS